MMKSGIRIKFRLNARGESGNSSVAAVGDSVDAVNANSDDETKESESKTKNPFSYLTSIFYEY